MDNNKIKEIENLPRVKELQEEIKLIQQEYLAKEKEEEKLRKQEYRNYYASLSPEEKIIEDIRIQKEKLFQLSEKQKQIKRSKKVQSERDKRTHLLCEIGGTVLALCKKNGITITEDMVSAVAGALSYEYKSSNENMFISNLKKELKNRTDITLTPVSFDLEENYDQ